MNLGDVLRKMVEDRFPTHASRTVTYSAKEAELQVKFNGLKGELPNAAGIGKMIAETLETMQSFGYYKIGRILTTIEAGVKLTITIVARTNSKGATQFETTPIEQSYGTTRDIA